MSSMPFCANIRAFIGRELRIVFRNRRSIAEMLQNHISFARSADARDWSCTCGHDVKDHICRRLSEVDPKVGALNSHDIPIPVRFTAHSNVAHGIASFVNDWQLSVDPPWLSTVLQKGKSTMTAPQVYEQIKDVCAAVPKVIAPGEGITVTTVERAKIQLTGMVISPLDKNNRAMFCECPTLAMKRLDETFISHPNFTKVDHSDDELLDVMKQSYRASKLHELVPWRSAGKISYGYCVPKNKDTKKSRGIVSMYNHPARRLLKFASRALTFLLNALPERYSKADKPTCRPNPAGKSTTYRYLW